MHDTFQLGKIALINVKTLAREQDIIVLHTHTYTAFWRSEAVVCGGGGWRHDRLGRVDYYLFNCDLGRRCVLGERVKVLLPCGPRTHSGSPRRNAIFNIHLDTTGGVARNVKLCVCVLRLQDRALSYMGFSTVTKQRIFKKNMLILYFDCISPKGFNEAILRTMILLHICKKITNN